MNVQVFDAVTAAFSPMFAFALAVSLIYAMYRSMKDENNKK